MKPESCSIADVLGYKGLECENHFDRRDKSKHVNLLARGIEKLELDLCFDVAKRSTALMADIRSCSRCGAPLPQESVLGGACPVCLLEAGLMSESADKEGATAVGEVAGRTLGHYRLLEHIAIGGMGIVYRARDEHLDRDVAVKLLPKGTLASEADRKRFRREARTLSKLNHPNICTVHDFDTQDGIDFLVMEYLHGPTLSGKLRDGPLPESEAVEIGLQVVEALDVAHERGIVHRDLKPANIVLVAGLKVKVLDFGLARSIPMNEAILSNDSLEAMGKIAGTVPYMAPEQLRGEKIDPRSDIYATGVVFYELATGVTPFAARTIPALIDAIMKDEPISPLERGARISPELERIILKCLDKAMGKRYQSAKELAVDLRRLSTPMSHRVRPGALQHVSRRIWVPATLALGLAALAVASNLLGVRDLLFSHLPVGKIESLVVLPLANLSGDPEQEYFADGMTEAIITNLARISAMRVVSRTSAMRFKHTTKLVPDIARELNVDAVVEGSVLRSDGVARITAKLVRAASEQLMWAESYERDPGNLVQLQNDVARAIVQAIRVHITPEEASRFERVSQVNREAHEAYLRGRWHWNKRTPDGFGKAVQYFREAIGRDPTYALAHAGLADTYALFGSIGYDVMPPHEAVKVARPLAVRALELDPSLAEAHCALAHIEHDYDWDLERAEQSFRRALELNPGYATAHQWLGLLLATRDRIDEAEAEIRRAQELDPLSSVIDASVGRILYYGRQYDAAAIELSKANAIDPDYAGAYLVLGMVHRQQGRLADALASFEKGAEVAPGSPAFLAGIGSMHALSGRMNEALRVVDNLLDMSKHRYVPAYYIGALYLDIGDLERGFDWLGKAHEERSETMLYLRLDPALDLVRADIRFQDLLRRVDSGMRTPQGARATTPR